MTRQECPKCKSKKVKKTVKIERNVKTVESSGWSLKITQESFV